jgi:hypothetical protein
LNFTEGVNMRETEKVKPSKEMKEKYKRKLAEKSL